MRTEIVALTLALLVMAGIPTTIIAVDALRPSNEIALVGHTPLNGNWSQREIHVKQGARVRIRLTSEDVTHGFYVPDLGINAGPISPGTFKTVELSATRPGTYTFYCNILCSHEHGGMVGKIVVE